METPAEAALGRDLRVDAFAAETCAIWPLRMVSTALATGYLAVFVSPWMLLGFGAVQFAAYGVLVHTCRGAGPHTAARRARIVRTTFWMRLVITGSLCAAAVWMRIGRGLAVEATMFLTANLIMGALQAAPDGRSQAVGMAAPGSTLAFLAVAAPFGDVRLTLCFALFLVSVLATTLGQQSARREMVRLLARDVRTRTRLAERAQEAAAAEDVARMGWWRLRAATGERSWSPGMFRVMGFPVADTPPSAAESYKLFDPEVSEELRGLVEAAIAGRRGFSVEHDLRLADGERRRVELRAHFREEGGEGSLYGVLRDVTESHRTLEALRHAREAADAASRAKSEFLGNMGHELRTPLTSILGFTQLLASRGDLDPGARSHVRRVGQAGRTLLALVDDILDFSRLEEGRLVVRPTAVRLAVLCREALEGAGAPARDKGLHLAGEIDAGLEAPLMLDAGRVRQILNHLLDNAVKFTEHGSVTLRAGLDGDRVLLEVADTGPGVAPEAQARLFEHFAQGDGSSTRPHGGAGLGLAVSRGLAEAMGGALGLESTPGRGSRFVVTLPAPAVLSETQAGALGDVRVLVADDVAANRDLARLFLSGAGAEITDARDGAHAVELASAEPFDVILMDMKMPRLDGLGALGRLRGGDGPNTDTPVLAFTANAGEMRDELLAAGFHDVVSKPITPPVLIAAVAQAAAAQDGWGALRVG